MYRDWPSEDQVRIIQNGSDGAVNSTPGFSINIEREPMAVPGKVEMLLTRFGWTHSQMCPNTKEQLWQKNPPTDSTEEVKKAWDNDLQNCHWYWYEAMAYEFGKFIGIGDDKDWNKSQGSAGMGSVDASTRR